MRCFFAEIETWDFDTAAVETLRLTDGPGQYVEVDGDQEWYEPALDLPDEDIYGRFLFGDGSTAGLSRVEVGAIAVLNTGGQFDYLRRRGFDGRAFRLYEGEQDSDRDEWTLVMVATQEQALPVFRLEGGVAESTIQIRLKDKLAVFDQPLQWRKYLGTNSGSVGLEGTAEDIKGLPLPVNIGENANVPAHPVNSGNRTYRIADGRVTDIEAVYDNGVALIDEGDVASASALAAASITSGRFKTCFAEGLFRLGAEPAGRVTADVIGGAVTFPYADATDFDGTDDGFSGEVLGTADVTRAVSAYGWFRLDSSAVGVILAVPSVTGSPSFAIFRDSEGELVFFVQMVNPTTNAATGTWRRQSTTQFTASSDWHWFLACFDLEAETFSLVIDGDTETTTGNPGTFGSLKPLGIPMTVGYGDLGTGNLFWNGALAEVWLGWGQKIDPTDTAVQDRFVSLGYPNDIGVDGSGATGQIPVLYLRGGPDQFGSNRGYGADLSVAGAPAIASSNPYAPLPSGGTNAVSTAEAVRALAVNRAGLPSDEVSDADFDAASLARPWGVGLWTDQETSVRPMIDAVAPAAHLGVWFDRLGVLRCGIFALPSGSPVFDLVWDPDGDALEDNILSIEGAPVRDTGNGLPAAQIVVEYGRNHTLQNGDGVAGSVSISRRAYLELEYRRASAEDLSVKTGHPNAVETKFTTLLVDADEAQDFADELLDLYSVDRQRFLVRTPMTTDALLVDLFDVVRLTMPRFDLDGGLLFRVIGIRGNYRARELTWDLWGGVYGAVEAPTLGNIMRVFAPSISQGVSQLSAPFLGDRLSIYAPTVLQQQRLVAPFLGNRLTLAVPTVLQQQFLAVPFLGARGTLYAPTVLQQQFVSPPYLGGRLTINAPSLSVTISAPFLGNRATIHAPAAVYDQTLEAPFLGNRLSIGAPVVQAGVLYLVAPFLGNRLAIYAPTAIQQQFLQPPFLGDRLTIEAPTAIQQQFLAPGYLGNRLTITAPTVVPDQILAAPFLGNRAVIYAPTLGLYVQAPSLGNRLTIYAPTITLGSVRTTTDGSTRTTTDGAVRTIIP